MGMFFGTYQRNLDNKFRLQLPNKLVKEMPEHFYLLRGFEGALSIYEEKDFQKYLSSLENKITTLKKSIKGECLSHQDTLKEIKALEKEKNEYPLIVSLKECEETIDSLVRRIQDLFII